MVPLIAYACPVSVVSPCRSRGSSGNGPTKGPGDMGIWRKRRTSSGVRRNVIALGVVLTLVAAVVPPATGPRASLVATAVPGDGMVNVPGHPEGASFNPNQ